jgi:molybdenum cofactor cytidylyltransferase
MNPSLEIRGVLLAAGHGRRWLAAGGDTDKLMHRLPDGTPMVVAAARALNDALPRSVAVVRPADAAVAHALRACGLHVVWADEESGGLGQNLAMAVASTPSADGCVVSLGDMPRVQTSTVAAVAEALADGHTLAAPFYRGERGHPVGFGKVLKPALLALRGDVGARELLRSNAQDVHRINVDDEGVLIDMDVPPA